MSQTPQPHISPALAHLRGGVTVVGVGLGVLLLAQVFVWAFVHFTDVRTTKLSGPAEPQSFEVIEGDAPVVGSLSGIRPRGNAGASLDESDDGLAAAGRSARVGSLGGGVDPNEVESTADRLLRAISAVVQTGGVIAAVAFAILLLQGVVIAAGAAVPGVEMAVTASTFGLVVALLAVPLVGMAPDSPFPGVFQSYDALIEVSTGYRTGAADAPGPIGFYLGYMLLPIVMAGGAAVVVLRFRAGVERGLISTTVSEAHERLEREIRGRKNLGEMATSRAMGALNATLTSELLAQHAVNLQSTAPVGPHGMNYQPGHASPASGGVVAGSGSPGVQGVVPLPQQPAGAGPVSQPPLMQGHPRPEAAGLGHAIGDDAEGAGPLGGRSILPDDGVGGRPI